MCISIVCVQERESCPWSSLTCSYITQVIFAHRSVLCCPVVLLFSVLTAHLGNCSTSSPRPPLHTSFCPNSGSFLSFPDLPCLQLNTPSLCKKKTKKPLLLNSTTDKHFADRVNFNIIGEEAVYLEWQLCLRGSEGFTAQLLIMDIRPRNWRPKFTSPTRLLAPILAHVVHKSWVSWRVYKCDSLNASHTLGNRSHHLCIIDIAPFYLPSCVSFPWKLRSYIHDGMKISN